MDAMHLINMEVKRVQSREHTLAPISGWILAWLSEDILHLCMRGCAENAWKLARALALDADSQLHSLVISIDMPFYKEELPFH